MGKTAVDPKFNVTLSGNTAESEQESILSQKIYDLPGSSIVSQRELLTNWRKSCRADVVVHEAIGREQAQNPGSSPTDQDASSTNNGRAYRAKTTNRVIRRAAIQFEAPFSEGVDYHDFCMKVGDLKYRNAEG